MPDNTINMLERDLQYWNEWAKHEQEALDKCEYEETKPYLERRLSMAMRNIVEIEKALAVFNNDTRSNMETGAITVGANA